MGIIKTESSEFLICGNAKRRYDALFNSIKHLHPVIADFVKRLCKNLDRGVNYMRYGFLPNINNQIECYNGVAFSKEKKDL
ncbi:MAG: hypothetical protein LBB45_08390 [Methanobrevibacter sp.]|jgi:hypothetical protein|nr:hypothetical protein [Candidatus Methanovirga basalitermitum]